MWHLSSLECDILISFTTFVEGHCRHCLISTVIVERVVLLFEGVKSTTDISVLINDKNV